MDLTVFKKVDQTISATTKLCLLINIIMAIAYGVSIYLLSGRIDNLYDKVPVVDASTGRVYEVTPHLAADIRKQTYEYRVEEFVKTWYGINEENYHTNIETALKWIGNRGKQLQNEYNDIDMFRTLYQNNISYEVVIEDIQIDMNAVPVRGYVMFTQIGYRAKGSVSRDIYAEFTLKSAGRSKANLQGVKIEDWKVKFSDFKDRD